MYGGQESSVSKPKGAKALGKVDAQAGTKSRATTGITLRNKERGDKLNKMRNREQHDDPSADPEAGYETALPASGMPNVDDPDNPMSYNQKTLPEYVPLRLLPVFAEMAHSDDPDVMFHGVLMVRKLLSVTENPPIQAVVDAGVVPRLVSLLPRDNWVELQFEAAWAVSNVASGTKEDTHLIIRLNAVPEFVRLLESPSEEVREQATWAVGNIAGESAECRDYILGLGAMPRLIKAISVPVSKITVLRNTVWSLSNLCRSKPPPLLEHVAPALPVLAALLNHHDKEVVTDAAWAVSYVCDGPVDRIQRVVQAGVLERIVAMLTAPNVAMQTPALRTIGNIVAGNDTQTQTIIDSGALLAFHFLLNHARRAIKKEACWCLSNICAGSVGQVQAVIAADLYPVVINLLDAPEYEVKKEAVWCIANTTSGGTREQLQYLIDVGIIGPLCGVLKLYDTKMVTVALEALENFLQLGKDNQQARGLERNEVADAVVTCGGLELIEALQEHDSPDLYHQSAAVIQEFFEFVDRNATATEAYDFTDDAGDGAWSGAGAGGGYAF